MSQSNRRRAVSYRMSRISVVALMIIAIAAHAQADPRQPIETINDPIETINAPILDISFGTEDLKGAARVEETPDDLKITFDATVLFGKDSDKIKSRADVRIKEVAAQLKAKGPGSVRIVGYTDDLGSAEHGLDLSKRRAQAVAARLQPSLPKEDFPFSVTGKGEADPAVPNDSEENRRRNRRVEVTYQADG